MRERYAIIGTGHRSQIYSDAIAGPHAGVAELVAWSDTNPGRLDYYEKRLLERGVAAPHRYSVDRLEDMLREHAVDRVIVTTPDFTHAELISRALEADTDVVVEKPLTIDAAGVRRIREARRVHGRDVLTTFNYRYSPRNSALKRVIQEGRIGEVTSLQFEWVLDTMHGADYFRRWHRDKANSGGLLVHKASHHFDLVNWWLAAAPTRVFASGGLKFYGSANAVNRGLGQRPERESVEAHGDPFVLDLRQDERLHALYRAAEKHDGYRRDRDVFDAGISIEDNISAVVDYDSGATMSYSLNAHSPWEGYRVVVNGTRGRAELEVVERAAVVTDAEGNLVLDPSASDAATAAGGVRKAGERLIVQTHWNAAEEVPIPAGIGGHGGGDAYLLEHLFNRVSADAPLERIAGFDAGVRAVSVGIAANRSLQTGNVVRLSDLDLG